MENDYKAMYEREKKSRMQAQIELSECQQTRNSHEKKFSIINSELIQLKDTLNEKDKLYLAFKEIAEEEIDSLIKQMFIFKILTVLLIMALVYIWGSNGTSI